jgi:hypothetical protein
MIPRIGNLRAIISTEWHRFKSLFMMMWDKRTSVKQILDAMITSGYGTRDFRQKDAKKESAA